MTDDSADRLVARPAPDTRRPAHPSISDAKINELVDAFYDAVWVDPRLGPIFAGRIEDRSAHLATKKRFWSSVLRKSGTYHGRPVLLGHSKIESTVRYLGIEVDDAIEIAEKIDI